MAEPENEGGADEQLPGPWRRGWASAGAVLATVLLIGLIALVTLSNRDRDEALAWERHTYDVMLLTRAVDATIARSEAALGRYVLDERRDTGTVYYEEWRLAGRQIGQLQRLVRDDREQSARLAELEKLYRVRGRELAAAAARAASKTDSGGVPLFYQAGLSRNGPDLRDKLDQVAASERADLRERIEQTKLFAAQADNLTEWLGWLGVLIGLAAITLGLAAYQAINERLVALRDADSEASRAGRLEQAVEERTRELRDANAELQRQAADRAVAEAQLRQVQKMEAVGQLTGGIAHDFNNMLAVVVGGIDLAKRKLAGSPQDVEAHLDNALEGATRAAALTRRLLAFARAEPLLPEVVAPATLVGGMLDLIDRTIGERISVETRFTEAPWHIWVDTNQLENAILNLAVNARDAMAGEGRLTIAIDNAPIAAGEVRALSAGDYVRISVADTGSGIAAEHLDRIFEPFFTTKPVGKGTGLGLSQIFGFAQQSGGEVAIETRRNVGTTFSIYLPRSDAAAAARRAPPDAQSSEAPHPPVATTILVVEDDPRVSRATVAALEELGYSPTACANGKEALDLIGRTPKIGLVVTDIMMPEMTGPELVRAMAESRHDIPVLFVTGFVGEAGDVEELVGHDILRKPFTVAALAEAVARTIAKGVSGSPRASTKAATG